MQKYEVEISRAINETLPTETGYNQRQIFNYARALKSLPGMADVDENTLRSCVWLWYEQAKSNIGSKKFFDLWVDFKYAWAKVKIKIGEAVFEQALRRARANPIGAKELDGDGRFRELIALCRELQSVFGDKPFYLSTRTVARLCSLDISTAYIWLWFATETGILKIAKKGDRKNATSYYYLGIPQKKQIADDDD